MGNRKQTQRWLDRHLSDPFVKLANRDGWRSRAVYKLAEIDERDRLFRAGTSVVDLGAAPGSWSQYAVSKVGETGKVIATDILPMESIKNVNFIQGDFREDSVLEQILAATQSDPIDLVICDIAPNITGVTSVDQPRSVYFAELALHLTGKILKPGGSFLVKLFQGEGFDQHLLDVKRKFTNTIVRKPKASRSNSREVYLLASNRKL